jgi:hypothetical protein
MGAAHPTRGTETIMKMTVTKFLTCPEYGCATAGELITFSRENPGGLAKLKEYAKQEMLARGIEVEETQK